MESKSSASKNLKPSSSYGFLDLQGSMQIDHQQSTCPYWSFMVYPQQLQKDCPVRVWNMQQPKQPEPSARNIDGLNIVEEDVDGNHEGDREKKESPWQRIKWTGEMVKLLINAVSYIGEEVSSDCNGVGRKRSFVKKGKWRCISKLMTERSYNVSPQQCEDKFNDLNKKYKRLNDVLGTGNACKVVEQPALLDSLDLSDGAKEDVRKILSSKQLFFEQMWSYHNGNRLYLPHDQTLQRSLQLALKSKDNDDPQESRLHKYEALDEDNQIVESVGRNDETEEQASLKGKGGTFVFPVVSQKRSKHGEEYEPVGFNKALNLLDCNKKSDPHPSNNCTNVNHNFTEGRHVEWIQSEPIMSRSLQLGEQKLQIKAQMLELEKQRLRWLRCSEQEDRELEEMRLENKYMKLENERLALEIKRRESGAN
ncbi:uncharacterized protein LOC132300359 isoform X1 [Cornus florida]|uniref:uncharacterized protein LOC132300359 isoform X1 n=1 Tax=Cornus florida TaxID=4283 RepID=UPI00289EA3AE|nr:uncharacterized protein LOC132300359 isoform X1 [Cornus florida]